MSGSSEYRCRVCGSTNHSIILDYGKVALAGDLLATLDHVEDEPRFPLSLVFCEECSHIQIREILDPAMLFSNYAWETGVGSSIFAYCKTFAERVATVAGLNSGGFVVEIASNDGTLLSQFQARGQRVLGVDPAKRIAEKAAAKGVPTLATFFNLDIAKRIVADQGKAQLIVGRNVIAHVADLHGLVEGIHTLLAPGGTAVIEAPHLVPMFKELQYDQVYHEHIGYHSLDSIRRLADMHGMKLIDAEMSPLHGGSIRAYLAHKDDSRAAGAGVAEILSFEKREGVLESKGWADFGARVREQKRLLRAELETARATGKVVVGYGASGKGQALIQFCELDGNHVNYIVDKAPIKHGKWTPGSHIPIYDPGHTKEAGIDIMVLFSWNLAAEILEQERELHRRGVRFIHPLPVPHDL